MRQKINNLVRENKTLDGEVRDAQENLRLSANQMKKLNAELAEYKNQISSNNSENETYRLKIQKLMQENTSLGDEVRGVQENLRLSSGTINKLTNELKMTCSENEELKRRLLETTNVSRKVPEYENKIALLSQEI